MLTTQPTPNYRLGGADDDPVFGLHSVIGLLPPPSSQPCPRKVRDLSCVRQENRLLVCRPCRRHQLIPRLRWSRCVLLSSQAPMSNAGAAAFPATWKTP